MVVGHKKRKATSTKPTIKLWQRARAKEGWCSGLSALSRSPGVCKQPVFDLLQQQIVFNIIYETLCFKQTPECLLADCWKHWHHKRGRGAVPIVKNLYWVPLMEILCCHILYHIAYLFIKYYLEKMVKRTVSRISLRSSLSKRLVVQKCVDVVTLQRSWLAIDQTPLI